MTTVGIGTHTPEQALASLSNMTHSVTPIQADEYLVRMAKAQAYMQANNINEQELIPPPPQPQAAQGGQMMPQQQMQMDPNQMMGMQQQMMPPQGMMQNGGVTYEVSGIEEQAPQSFYEYALGERDFLLSNPDMWNEDPEMMYEDGTFKFCLDCLNKDFDNPDHLKGIVRLIDEGLTEPPHYDLDLFNEKLIQYNIEPPKSTVENIKRHGGFMQNGGTQYNLIDNEGNMIPPNPNYQPPGVPSYPDFSNWDNIDMGTQLSIIKQMIADPTQFNPEDIEKYGPQDMTQEEMNIINRENANKPPIRIPRQRYGGWGY